MRQFFLHLFLFSFIPLNSAFSMELSTLSVEMERLKKPITYTYKISGNKSKSRGLQITEFKQTKNSVLIKIKSHRPSAIHLASESCVERGFIFCKSFGSVLYKLMLRESSAPLKYVTDFKIKKSYIKKIDYDIIEIKSKIKKLKLNGTKFTNTQRRLENKIYEKKAFANGLLYVDDKRVRPKVLQFSDLNSNTLTLNFNYSGPKIKTFSLREGGYGTDNFYDLILPSLADEEVAYERELLKLTKLHDEPIDNIKYTDLKNLIDLYSDYPKVKNYFASLILKKFDKVDNAINPLVDFISHKHTSHHSKNIAIKLVYSTVDKQNNIAGYNWFLSNFPASKEARIALNKLHKLSFAKAKEIGTLNSINDFIIAFPLSQHIKQANAIASSIEEKQYSGWFTSDEKNSRALLIKSKQMARRAKNIKNEKDRFGYIIVVNRMNELLQNKFPAEEATLRHLESEEFKDFVKQFNTAIKDIKNSLKRIANNTQDISSIIKTQNRLVDNHFRQAALSQKMANEYTKQHRFWQRYIKKN